MPRPDKKVLEAMLRDLSASQEALDSYITKIAKKGDKKLRKLAAELTSTSAPKLLAGSKKGSSTNLLDDLWERERKRLTKADKSLREPMARAAATRLISTHVGEIRAAAQIALVAKERKIATTLTRLADSYTSSLVRLDGAAARATSGVGLKTKTAAAKAKPVAPKRSVAPKAGANAKVVTKAKPKAVAKAQPKTVAKAKPKTVAKAKPKAAVKAKPKAAVKAKPKTVAKAKPKAAVKAKPKTVAKAKPKTAGRTTSQPRRAASKTTTRRRVTSKA